MKSLNTASWDVWSEYMNENNRIAVTERIIFLDTLNILTPDEEQELEILQNIEKKFLIESAEIVDENKRYMRVFNHYRDILSKEKDDRLLTIFYERVSDNLAENEECSEEDLKNIYINLMEEDMDVKGHDELTKFYEEIKKDVFTSVDNQACDDPDCIYCRPTSATEYVEAINDLTDQGYFNEEIPVKDLMVKLMVTIHRLQDELIIYKPGSGDDTDLDDDDDGF